LEFSAPLTSVRQSLNSLFEEARQRSDSIMKLVQESLYKKKQKNFERNRTSSETIDQLSSNKKHRKEIWFKPQQLLLTLKSQSPLQKIKNQQFNDIDRDENESDIENQNSDNDDDVEDDDTSRSDEEDDLIHGYNVEGGIFLESQKDIRKLSINELNKRFMLNYLNVIGKLFTKVGMESYIDVCARTLIEFKELLRREPCALGIKTLLYISVINLSILDLVQKSSNNNVNNNSEDNSFQRSQLVDCALQLSIDMFIIVANRFKSLLAKSLTLECNNDDDGDPENEPYLNQWRQFFPCIKVFIDWMLCNSNFWLPFPDQLPPNVGMKTMNRWKVFVSLFNCVNEYRMSPNWKLQLNDEEDLINFVKLEEDLELSGFVPLLALPRADYSTMSIELSLAFFELTNHTIEKLRDRKRINKLCFFADYLCGIENPILKYDVIKQCYTLIETDQTTTTTNKQQFERKTKNNSISSISSGVENNLNDLSINNDDDDDDELDEDNESEWSNEMKELKQKRRLLKAKVKEKEKQKKIHQDLVEMNIQRRIEIEIRPKFICCDTNCFIDHLNLINKILETNYYIVIVPLLVINELDKLAKSLVSFNDDSIEHAEYVQKSAKEAIKYLVDKFDRRERNLKALTSQGSVLETIQFRSEEVRGKVIVSLFFNLK
jgi:protein SMG6